MPFKDPQKRREYARKFYSSPEQKAKKKAYDHARYELLKPEIRRKNDRHLRPYVFIYGGDWACSRCGSTNRLTIHHKDHNHNNNDPSNLVCLCRSCHASLHANTCPRDWHGRFESKSKEN